MTVVAALAGVALLAKSMVVLVVIGRCLDEADRKGGKDARRLRRRAMWFGVEEAVWLFGVCGLLSVA